MRALKIYIIRRQNDKKKSLKQNFGINMQHFSHDDN